MERHKCKICYRKFANGRALGGHMRSHMMNLPIPPPKPPSYETESWTESSSSSSSSEDEDLGEIEKGLADNYKLRENPRKSSKIADVEFSSLGSSSISVTLREERERKSPSSISETTSSMSPATASSMSDVTSEEDVALCLMMLSRDNWVSGGGGKERFKCYTCGKVFKSYQALGGHRASHNKLRPPAKAPAIPGSDPVKQFKVHECPVCLRVFASAQALGGHKRAHSVNAKHGSQFIRAESDSEVGSLFHIKKITKFKSRANGVRKGKKIVSLIHMEIDTDFKRSNGPCLNRVRVDTDFNTSSNDLHQSPRNDGMIDLNLPAPVDQDDEISQVSFS